MDKVCLIHQHSGIGDIFWIQKIVHHFHDLGYKVILPVLPQILWIKDYLITPAEIVCVDDDFPKKEFYQGTKSIITDDFVYLPLGNLNGVCHDKIMNTKYIEVGLDWEDWLNYFDFKRDPVREKFLYHNVLGLEEDTRYVLRNRLHATPSIENKTMIFDKINLKSDLKIIDMKIIKGLSLIDWYYVLENAEEIWTINTVIGFILEHINKHSSLNAKKLELWSTRPYEETNYIWTLPWHRN